MWVRLTRKLAAVLDGIDVSNRHVGEVFDVPVTAAYLLIAEEWAEPHLPTGRTSIRHGTADALRDFAPPDLAALVRRLGQMRANMDRRQFAEQQRRRVEDHIREELRDRRARTIRGGRSVS